MSSSSEASGKRQEGKQDLTTGTSPWRSSGQKTAPAPLAKVAWAKEGDQKDEEDEDVWCVGAGAGGGAAEKS